MNTFLVVSLLAYAFFILFGVCATIASVGKTRKPLTPGVAVATFLIQAFFVTVIILSAVSIGSAS